MQSTPDITVGFSSGAHDLLANFAGNYVSSNQRASMAQCNSGDSPCCFGSIQRSYASPAITMFGAPAEDVSEASFFVEATACSHQANFSLVTREKEGIRRVKLTYNPNLTGRTWKVIYGMLLREIWLAGLKERSKAQQNPDLPTFRRGW